MPNHMKQQWTTPAVTRFANIDELREHLVAGAGDDLPAVEAAIDSLRRQHAVPGHDRERRKLAAGRRA